jgi:hypothetical protein
MKVLAACFLCCLAGMFGFFFCEGPIMNFEQASEKADTAKFARFHRCASLLLQRADVEDAAC